MSYKINKKIKSKTTKTVICITNAGFVSLIALLLANVFLLIGMSVFAISIKELSLSFGGRESLFAFYAADGGMECALYWDIQQEAFAITAPPRLAEITCNNKTIDVVYNDTDSDWGKSSFNYIFGNDDTFPCVTVEVFKKKVILEDDLVTIRIVSRGRNNCNLSDPRRVERAWRVTYK